MHQQRALVLACSLSHVLVLAIKQPNMSAFGRAI